MVAVIYIILGYWATGVVLFQNKIVISTFQSFFIQKLAIGTFFGFILIPLAIIMKILRIR